MNLKQLDFHSKTIGDNTFYIRPLPAFKAANISGDLVAILMPLLSGFAPLISSDKGIEDISLDEAAPALSEAFNTLSGDKLEKLLKRLIIDCKNISVETPDSEKPEPLTENLANELFCTDVQQMFMLAFEVIRINYGGFFERLSDPSGKVMSLLTKLAPESGKSTESST